MSKEEFIGKMQMAYFGEKNALEECVQEYLTLQKLYDKCLSDNVKTTKRKNDFEQALNEIKKICDSVPRNHSICDISKIHDIEVIIQKIRR